MKGMKYDAQVTCPVLPVTTFMKRESGSGRKRMNSILNMLRLLRTLKGRQPADCQISSPGAQAGLGLNQKGLTSNVTSQNASHIRK